MTILVRRAALTDTSCIAEFQILMARETEAKELSPAIVTAGVTAVFADPQRGFYLVAEIDQSIVGSLLVTYEWSDWRNVNQWYLQSVFVRAEFRSRGVFKQMFSRVVELATEKKTKHLRLYVEAENGRAQAVYESLGMQPLPYRMYDLKIGDFD